MIGVWHDAGAHRAYEYAQLYRELGISYVQVMIDQQAVPAPGGVHPLRRWDEAMVYPVVSNRGDRCPSLTATVHTFRDAGLEVGLALWPHLELSPEQQADYLAYIEWAVAYLPISNVEMDVEPYNATRHGERPMRSVLPLYADAIRSADLVRETPCEVWATAVPAEMGVTARSIPGLDVMQVQAYSTYEPKYGDGYGHPYYGPGAIQTRSADQWATIAEGLTYDAPDLVMGLAAYRQRYPGRTLRDAMEPAIEAGFTACDRVCYWSGRHVFGDRAVQGFIQSWTRSNA